MHAKMFHWFYINGKYSSCTLTQLVLSKTIHENWKLFLSFSISFKKTFFILINKRRKSTQREKWSYGALFFFIILCQCSCTTCFTIFFPKHDAFSSVAFPCSTKLKLPPHCFPYTYYPHQCIMTNNLKGHVKACIKIKIAKIKHVS